jgi:uncharacterized protein YoxC
VYGYHLLTLVGLALLGVMVATVFYAIERKIVSVNETLQGIKASLVEATAELVSKIQELEDLLAQGETVDPQLLADVKGLAEGLAGIVENAPVEDETPAE